MTAPAPPVPVPLEPALFASLDPPVLIGSRCAACAAVAFPAAAACPACSAEDVAPMPLPAEGRLWSWTVQRIQPKRPYVPDPAGFEPFPVGYVDLGTVLVESRLDADPGGLSIGMPLRLVLLPVPADAGEEPGRVTFAFAPAGGSE